MAVSSKSEAQNQKPGMQRQGDKRAVRSRRRCAVALEQLQKRSLGRVFAALVWSRAPRFDARLCTGPLVPPFVYKIPEIFRAERRSFDVFVRLVFRVFSLL